MKTKVLIVDDHPFTRVGVRFILEANPSIDIIAEAKDGLDAVKQAIETQPDIVVMDITMPGLSGIEATRKILKKLRDVKIIALSIHKGEVFVKRMLDAGALGYLLKDEAPEELLKAIEKVNKGEMYLSSGIIQAALSKDENIEKISKIRILKSRLCRPPITTDYVVRAKIIHELENNIAKPLSLISAGAGYGKSITVSQWLQQTQFLHSWISLSDEHNDIRTFLSYIVASIEQVYPGLLTNIQDLASAPFLPPVKEISDQLINDLCDIDEDFILVLDDYHVIKESIIHDLLDEWLRFPPPHIHLCIVTRRDPPLKIKSLQLSGRMTEIRMDALSFTGDEITELFKQISDFDLKAPTTKILQDKTEGWIIGLRLISMIIREEKVLDKQLQSMEGGLKIVSEYLLTEVLSNQPEHIRDQLIITSVLNRFCDDLIEELSFKRNADDKGGMSGNEIIQWLINFNLFVIPLDNEKKWFRYQNLFQNFLQNQLKKKRTAKQVEEIHINASQWFERNDFITEAIEHAVKANDTDRVKRIIVENWEDTFDLDFWTTVEKWILYLPEVVVDKSANLLLARMWIAQRSHKLALIPGLIEKVEKTRSTLTNTETGYLAFAKCMLFYFIGDSMQSLDAANQALNLIPKTYKCFRADAYLWWSFSMLMNGKEAQALQQFKVNLKSVQPPGEPIQTTRILMHPSFIAITRANIPVLKRHNSDFFKINNISAYMLGWGTYIKSMISWWIYDLVCCKRDLEQFLQHKYQTASASVMDGYVCLALVNQELELREEANKTIDRGIQYANNLDDPSAQAAVLSGQARLNLLQGNMKDAEAWLNVTEAAQLTPAMFFFAEIPAITRCRVLTARGTKEDLIEALELLDGYKKYSESIFNKLRTIDILVLQTLAYNKLTKEDEAMSILREAIEMSAVGEWIRPFAEQEREISDLLWRLKEDGVQPAFIDMIFKAIETGKSSGDIATEAIETLAEEKPKEKPTIFTAKELEVLACVAKGLRNKEIAIELFNSEETIKRHIYNMFQKMNVKNRLSLVSRATEAGILEKVN